MTDEPESTEPTKPPLAHPELPSSDPRNIPAMVENAWKPGQSGNPKGRPPRKTFEALVNHLLDEVVAQDDDGNDITRREHLAIKFIDMMLNQNNPAMLREYMEREWVKPQRIHEVQHSGELKVVMDEQDLRWDPDHAANQETTDETATTNEET